MPAPKVRSDLGPSLPALLRAPWRRLPRWGRRAGIVLVVVLAVAVVVVLTGFRVAGGSVPVIRPGPPAVTLGYFDDRLELAPTRAGEIVRLRTLPGVAGPETFVVRDGGPAPRRALGDPVAQLALRFAPLEQRLSRLEGFQLRSEGRVRVNEASGWSARFQYVQAGRTYYGVRMLLTPDEPVPGQRIADVEVRAARSPVTPNATSTAANGPMKRALLSLRFGGERP